MEINSKVKILIQKTFVMLHLILQKAVPYSKNKNTMFNTYLSKREL